jgi:hypothetical protein
MAGMIGACLLGLPTEASGKSKSKKQYTKSAKATKATKSSSRSTSSPRPDYKSKYRKKDPPPNGGRHPKQKYKYDPQTKHRRPPSGKLYQKPRDPRPRPRPDYRPPGHRPPIIIHPIVTPVVIVEPYEDVYYESYYEEQDEQSVSADGAAALFAGGSIGLNYVFIRDGEISEFAAGVGFFFGIAALAQATSPHAKHPLLSALLGSAAIVFSAWNLAGGMDNHHSYDGEEPYDGGYESYYSARPTGQAAGWTFSF